MNFEIRAIKENDWSEIEALTRAAFWNRHAPGCDEHYLVHIMRHHPDFCPELSFVAECDGRIVGNILYTRSKVVATDGTTINTLTFGPLSVLPEMQRKGIGSALVRHTKQLIDADKFPAVVIYGNPSNYVSMGFVSASKLGICAAEGIFPTAMLALPFDSAPFSGKNWVYAESSVYSIDRVAAENFDRSFPPMKKEYKHSQEEFNILSRSIIRVDAKL